MEEKKVKKLINSTQPQFKLKKVTYNDIGFSDDILEDIENSELVFTSMIVDNYEINDYNNDYIVINYLRKISFEPKSLFEIEVSIDITYDLNDSAEKEIELSNLKEELEERKETLLTPAIHKASLLIGDLTNINTNDFPLITPPYYHDEKK